VERTTHWPAVVLGSGRGVQVRGASLAYRTMRIVMSRAWYVRT
jgi:hypothetical protein